MPSCRSFRRSREGIDPGFVFYTQVSGHYTPFYTQVIAATVSEAPYVLDGMLHHVHQTDLRIREHYTDTAGATDHVFGLCCLLGFQFAPRIKDLKDRKLYTIETPGTYLLLEPLIGGIIDPAAIISQWPELMRVKASIEAGAVLPSVILGKLAAAGPGNALSRALRMLGQIERTLFTLQWLSDPDLRQRSHAGLNKGEASNSLRRAVFFHRQGEIRGRTTAEPRAVVNVNRLNDRARFTSVPAGYDFEGETSENRSSRHAANWMSAIIGR